MNRRVLLKGFCWVPVWPWVPTFVFGRAEKTDGRARSSSANRILVLVELEGGCDGLNMAIPYGDDGYFAARPKLAIPHRKVLKLSDTLGLHPSLADLKDLYERGLMAVALGVGYPEPTRSHLESRKVWYTGSTEQNERPGWLAAYLQGRPAGDGVKAALAGCAYPADGQRRPASPLHDAAGGVLQRGEGRGRGIHIAFPIDTAVGNASRPSRAEYPDHVFGASLSSIARMIASDSGVEVFYTVLRGFDTHTNQVERGNSVQGVHSNLLVTLSTGIQAFMDELKEMRRLNEVLVVTFSEFGRRLHENATLGTDHGTANAMFFIGGQLKPGVYGEQPRLDKDRLDDVGDMIHALDFRSVYATILDGWLHSDPGPVIGGPWSRLALL